MTIKNDITPYTLLFLIAIFLSLNTVSAQTDKDALQILDAFSSKAKAAPSISMKFDLVTVNQVEKTSDTISGNVVLSGDKYRLELPNNIVFFTGETIWSYLPNEKEVTITRRDKKDDSFQNKPSAIFSMYKKGYKNRLIEEKQNSYIIDLYPEDIKTDLLRIRLTIGKPQFNLINLEYKRKDGITSTLQVRLYDLTLKPDTDTFTFRKEKYPDVEVIDMR